MREHIRAARGTAASGGLGQGLAELKRVALARLPWRMEMKNASPTVATRRNCNPATLQGVEKSCKTILTRKVVYIRKRCGCTARHYQWEMLADFLRARLFQSSTLHT